MTPENLPTVSPDQLAVGLYVHLDMRWIDHPFLFNQFKIRDDTQIQTLRALGKSKFRYDPSKSDVVPPQPGAAEPAPAQQETSDQTSTDQAAIQAKLARIARIREQRAAINACERTFLNAASTVRNLTRNLFARPEESVRNAEVLISSMADSLLTDRDIAIHLMNDKIAGEEVYLHSLNVSVLAMILGKEMDLDAGQIRLLGMGGLFHDIGKVEIPDKILLKTQPLSHAEEAFLREHVAYGLEIGRKLNLPKEVLLIIGQHHEAMDGSGYPAGLHGEAQQLLARIVALVNAYDNLCNPVNINQAITPHEALSRIYSRQRKCFDANALNIMVRCLGVYPPGTVVALSNESLGMVMSVNPSKPLRPSVLIYDPGIPKDEAMIIDLEQEPDIHISKALRPNQLPRQIYEYLSPRKRTTYYFDEKKR